MRLHSVIAWLLVHSSTILQLCLVWLLHDILCVIFCWCSPSFWLLWLPGWVWDNGRKVGTRCLWFWLCQKLILCTCDKNLKSLQMKKIKFIVACIPVCVAGSISQWSSSRMQPSVASVLIILNQIARENGIIPIKHHNILQYPEGWVQTHTAEEEIGLQMYYFHLLHWTRPVLVSEMELYTHNIMQHVLNSLNTCMMWLRLFAASEVHST